MDIVKVIEFFALVTGIPYIVLEVMQKNAMWYFGIATGLACAYSFAVQNLWASMGLNIYYVGMSVWGLYQWRKDAGSISESDKHAGTSIHLTKLTKKTALVSLAVFLAGTAALIALLVFLNDKESNIDAIVTVMSAIAMYWLGKSYPQHWLIWIVADIMLTGLCFMSGMYWMAALYGFYIASAAYGFFHWRKHGTYVA